MVPLLSEALLEAVPDAPRALAALGVFGCEAARHLGALTAFGDAAACSFFSLMPSAPLALRMPFHDGASVNDPRPKRDSTRMPPAEPSRSLGSAWDGDATLAALRAYHAAPPEPCRSCALLSVCRGGCQVVSRRSRWGEAPQTPRAGSFAPDPECPRVMRAAAK
jgi:hypothetical protein